MNHVRKLEMNGYMFVNGDLFSVIHAMFAESKEEGRCCLVFTPNLSMWGSIEKNSHLGFIKNASKFHLPDGWPIALALSKKYHTKIDRTAGSDLLPQLFSYCSRMQYRMVILGGHEGYESKLTDALLSNDLSLKFRIINITSQSRHKPIPQETISDILDYNPDVIVICLGFPKQEFAGVQLQEHFAIPILCLGASLDFVVSPHLRAPRYVISLKLEWFWRLVHEPRRLFKRYFVDAVLGIPSLIRAIFS
jgi:N-acetylglucosaminyldiphosphoundecaprenol N-acetyl-beta-D-mannosaminyltransferase